MGAIGTFLMILLLCSVYASLAETFSTKAVPVKTDWSPETLAAVERKRLREANKSVLIEKHPDNPLTWLK